MGVLHADDGTALAGVTNPETNAGDARLDEGVGCALISSGPDDEGTAEDRTRLRAWRGRPPRRRARGGCWIGAEERTTMSIAETC